MLREDFGAALLHYARLLEEALRRSRDVQTPMDLPASARALGGLGCDAEALEVWGAAEAAMEEILIDSTEMHILDMSAVDAAAERLGPAAATAARERGRQLPAGQRIPRTCELNRAAAGRLDVRSARSG